jgi:hypothetical protein
LTTEQLFIDELVAIRCQWRIDTEHNDTQHNGASYDSQHNSIECHYLNVMLSVVRLNVFMLSVVAPLTYLPIKQRPDHCGLKVEKNQQVMIITLLHKLSGNFSLNNESLAKFSTLEVAACIKF